MKIVATLRLQLPGRVVIQYSLAMARITVFFIIGSALFVAASDGVAAAPRPSPASTPPGITTAEEATRAWLATIPAQEKRRSDAYFEGTYWLLLWNYLLAAAIALALLATGISARLRDLAAAVTRHKLLQPAIYGVAFACITWLLGLPLSYYEDFLREHQYGMSNQTVAAWFSDQLKMLLVALVLLPLAMAVLYAVFRRTPRNWWLWGSLVVTIFIALLGTAGPVFIEPLFNKYTPLTDPSVRDPILAMARANEIPVNQVFVVDQSRQTKRVSANVAGLAGTTRIALNDNLLNQCTLPEIREVMAHEMGHYVLNHGFKIVVWLAIVVFAGFALTARVFDWFVKKFGTKWRVTGISDPAGLPVLVLILSTYIFLLTPITNTVTRTFEREADAFGINAAREPDAMAQVALKLGRYRKMDPGPLEEFVFFDHPSGRARIRMAMDFKYAQP